MRGASQVLRRVIPRKGPYETVKLVKERERDRSQLNRLIRYFGFC
jgi:hypothetical protein